MTITATVLEVEPRGLLVQDRSNGQEIFVNSNMAQRFSPGNIVRITYNGPMTTSIPPQITARSITRVFQLGQQRPPQPPPQPMVIRRARVLQIARNTLTVLNLENNRRYIVIFQQAEHFCPGQLIRIRFSSITSTTPPRVAATEIRPIC